MSSFRLQASARLVRLPGPHIETEPFAHWRFLQSNAVSLRLLKAKRSASQSPRFQVEPARGLPSRSTLLFRISAPLTLGQEFAIAIPVQRGLLRSLQTKYRLRFVLLNRREPVGPCERVSNLGSRGCGARLRSCWRQKRKAFSSNGATGGVEKSHA